jgi:hypothetical protein
MLGSWEGDLIMSLRKAYNSALKRVGGFHAAWFPLTAKFQLGDYGLIHDGVFEKLGHIQDLWSDSLKVDIRTTIGNPVQLDLVTEGVKTIKTAAGADVAIPNFPDADVNASLTYEFHKENSFVVKCATMSVQQMDNIHQVAEGLARLRREKKWTHKFKVVSAVYTAVKPLVLLTSKADTKITFEAKANALQQLDLGHGDVNASVAFASDTVVKVPGEIGPIGLNLFKLKWISLDGIDLDLLAANGTDSAKMEVDTTSDEVWNDDF